MTERPCNVLFLCTGNSARSILAEAILRNGADDRFHAYSAGSQPKGSVHPFALDLLASLGLETEGLRSKSWDEFAGPDMPEMDLIFTVCDSAAAESCPVWPGHPMTAHWPVPDPAAAEGTEAERHAAFSEAFRILSRRIDLLRSLPMERLDKLALRNRVEAIGRDELLSL